MLTNQLTAGNHYLYEHSYIVTSSDNLSLKCMGSEAAASHSHLSNTAAGINRLLSIPFTLWQNACANVASSLLAVIYAFAIGQLLLMTFLCVKELHCPLHPSLLLACQETLHSSSAKNLKLLVISETLVLL